MKTNYAVLILPVPSIGRNLTATEVDRMRAAGYRPISIKWRVVPAGTPAQGYLYRPFKGGMISTGVVLTMK